MRSYYRIFFVAFLLGSKSFVFGMQNGNGIYWFDSKDKGAWWFSCREDEKSESIPNGHYNRWEIVNGAGKLRIMRGQEGAERMFSHQEIQEKLNSEQERRRREWRSSQQKQPQPQRKLSHGERSKKMEWDKKNRHEQQKRLSNWLKEREQKKNQKSFLLQQQQQQGPKKY